MSRTHHHNKNQLKEPIKTLWMSGGWCKNEPKSWRRMMKHKKRRCATRIAAHKAKHFPEETIFPLDSRPWIYYW